MTRVFALILAIIGGVFVYYAAQEETLSLTRLSTWAYYLTVAFIALVNGALFAAASFVEE